MIATMNNYYFYPITTIKFLPIKDILVFYVFIFTIERKRNSWTILKMFSLFSNNSALYSLFFGYDVMFFFLFSLDMMYKCTKQIDRTLFINNSSFSGWAKETDLIGDHSFHGCFCCRHDINKVGLQPRVQSFHVRLSYFCVHVELPHSILNAFLMIANNN